MVTDRIFGKKTDKRGIIKAKKLQENQDDKKSDIQPLVFFPPMKSKSGIRKEFFGWQEMEEFWKEWAKSRADGGVSIEAKIDGFRCQIHGKEGKAKIFLEESDRDFSPILPEIVEVIKGLDKSIILDSELYSDTETITPVLFNILWWGKSLVDIPYEEQHGLLSRLYEDTALSEFKLMPYQESKDKKTFLAGLEEMDKVKNSEGAMLKELKSQHVTGGRENTWAKIKRVEKIRAKVLKVRAVKGMDAFRYQCGVKLREEDVDRFRREDMQQGHLQVGWTMNTSTRAHVGDNLVVQVASITLSRVPIRGGRAEKEVVKWKTPVVKDTIPRPSFTVQQFYKAAQLLPGKVFFEEGKQQISVKESWTEYWSTIESIESEAIRDASVEQLASWESILEDIVSTSPYEIERRYAQDVLDDVQTALEAKREKADEIRKEIARKREEISRLETQIRYKEQEIQDLKRSLNDTQTKKSSSQDELSERENELAYWQDQLDNALNRIDELESQLDSLEDQRDDLEDELSSIESDLSNKEDRLDDLEDELSDLEDELEYWEDQLDNCEDIYNPQLREPCIENSEEHIDQLEDDISWVESDIYWLEWEIDDLEDSISQKESELESVEADISEVGDRIGRQRRKAGTCRNQISLKENQISELEDEIASYEGQIEEIQDAINSLRSEISSLEDQVSQLEDDIADLEEDLEMVVESYRRSLVQGIDYYND